MHKSTLILELVVIASGSLLIFLGYLIKYKKKVNMLSGYDETLVQDKDGLANFAGASLIILGLISILLGLVIYFFPTHYVLIMNIFTATIIIGCIIMVLGSKRYQIKKNP